MPQLLKEVLKKEATQFGFSDLRFISARPLLEDEKLFHEWRNKGYAAEMSYMTRVQPINARPEFLLNSAKTLLIFTADYYSPVPARPSLDYGRIASYAVGKDYHKVLKKKIQELTLHSEAFKNLLAQSRFFTDAVPLLEKSFAVKAGLGFQGKNTLLISKKTGSYKFIAELITDLEFEPDSEESEHNSVYNTIAQGAASRLRMTNDRSLNCAKCTRCIDICPTGALDDLYFLDARKCISYWTIENRGEIPVEMRKGIGEWVFGCDLCQEVCPYNRKASTLIFPEFSPEAGAGHWLYLPLVLSLDRSTFEKYFFKACEESGEKRLLDYARKEIFKLRDKNPEFAEVSDGLKNLSNKDFDELLDKIFFFKFGETPLSRSKRKGLIRNALIVTENSLGEKSLEMMEHLLSSRLNAHQSIF
ncbi:MAG: epoxyqueuosine reductase [bacterium]